MNPEIIEYLNLEHKQLNINVERNYNLPSNRLLNFNRTGVFKYAGINKINKGND